MQSAFRLDSIEFFNDARWETSITGRESCVTPLFTERYRGIRNTKIESTHAYWEFTGVISGNGYVYAGKKYPVTDSSVVLIAPGISHHEHAEQKLDTIWLGFKADLPRQYHGQVLQLQSPLFIEKLIQFWQFTRHNIKNIGDELDGLLLNLVGLFFRQLNDHQQPFHDIAQRAVYIMNEHFHEPLSMADMAKNMHCSEGHFFRRFKEFTGQTPAAYLNSIRIKQASFYLTKSDLQVNHIAELCGFTDPYYFSRAFHRHTGKSPTDFRNQKNKT